MLESKLPDIGTTIFSDMTALAQKHGAINLAQGFPDYDPDPALIAAAELAATTSSNQYAPMPGIMALRERVAEKYRVVYDIAVDPTHEITITPGATAALTTAIFSVVKPGDEVIIFTPAYDSYAPAVRLCGGIVREVRLGSPHYKPDWDQVRSLLNERTSLVIINSPHNPTGIMLDEHDMYELASILENSRALLLSDEVYELITFDGSKHVSALSIPALRERAFIITSFGKSCHVTGWKIGVCVCPPALSQEFRKVHQFVSFSVHMPAQTALAMYLADTSVYLGLSSFFQKKRDLFRSLIEGSVWTLRECNGTYFQLLGYSQFSNENDVDIAKRLTKDAGVASIPLSPFGANDKALRFCFAKSDETLIKAAGILVTIGN